MMMVENMVSKMTDAPFIGFTADDEASLQQYNWSPLYWLRRLYIHFKFANHAKKLYKYYWTFSEEQALDYTKNMVFLHLHYINVVTFLHHTLPKMLEIQSA